ncbi:MAG: N-acetylmuramoyl-L-alanine amidase [Polyangia bacterium]
MVPVMPHKSAPVRRPAVGHPFAFLGAFLFSCVVALAPAVAAPGHASSLTLPTATTAVPTVPPVVVALDAGHGGTNLGAAGVGRGIYEKKVMLALAEQIRSVLEQPGTPEISVVLCRQSDVLVPIRARARCARDSGARAFVSLHANAVPAGVRPGSQRGFEVFVLGPREVEDDTTLASLGRREDAEAVWAAHEVRAAAEQSIALGRQLADSLTHALGAGARRGIKQSGAALDVLRGTGTAAALVEVGFLDHPEEGARLATPEGRQPIADAIAMAIRAYVSGPNRLAVAR